ncbi:ATP-binding protein [Pseudomonas jilinensis]|uniref:Sensory/regulatory protein RpfC n=1 Tax=Pseudomonas jilinensis TaxID=2078689 RepID=A0A396SCE9_9PSED|nr:hybrid sensor histidine kinase/response regulator [Pseudomonas jilinensis]
MLLSLALVGYFISARLDDVNQALNETGQRIAEQLATAAEYGVISGNIDTLESLVRGTLDIPHVQHVQVFDSQGQILLSLERQPPKDGQRRHFTADILRERVALHSDLFLLDTPTTPRGEPQYLGQVSVGLSNAAFLKRQRQILLSGLGLAALTLIAALILALRLAQALAKPLRDMSQAVNALSQGQLNTRLNVSDQHEIGHLMSNINALASTLEQARQEQQQAIEQLVKAREEAESANRAKSDFLAMMSHELRTPMNGVLGMLQLLETTELNREQTEYVEIAGDSTDHLLKVINDILDFSRIERGAVEIEHIGFDLPQLLRSSVAVFEHAASQKGLSLITELQGDPMDCTVVGDPTRIRQILVNLIGNALKFTEQGSIRLRADWSEDGPNQIWLQCRVEDTGIGIASDRLDSMFEAFRQADSSTSRRFGGTGLGLSIARTFAHHMGGELTAVSREGHGSCFTLSLPLTRSLAPLNAQSASTTRVGPHDNEQPILLVEDNPVNQMVIEGMLRSLSLRVEVAATGTQALERLRTPEQHYAAILMDIQLPDIDGLEVCRQYRQYCQTQHIEPIPCIALTASAFELDRQHCLAAGMQDFLGKPVSRQALQAALERCRNLSSEDH